MERDPSAPEATQGGREPRRSQARGEVQNPILLPLLHPEPGSVIGPVYASLRMLLGLRVEGRLWREDSWT